MSPHPSILDSLWSTVPPEAQAAIVAVIASLETRIAELEQVLGIHAYAVNWPLGDGKDFRGLFDRQTRQVHFFERVPNGAYSAPVSVHDLSDPVVREQMAPDAYTRVVDELAMLEGAGAAFDHAAVLGTTLWRRVATVARSSSEMFERPIT